MGIRQLAERAAPLDRNRLAGAERPARREPGDTRAGQGGRRAAGYVPNQSGRSLRSGRTGIVAAVIPTRRLRAERRRRALHRARGRAPRRCARHALDLIVLFRGPDEDPLENLQRSSSGASPTRVIISETTARDPRLAYLQAAGVDYVAFGRSAGLEDYPFVDFDFESVGAEAARLFAGDGHRRLALAAERAR